MPIYEYKCAACEGVFEIKQSFADAALTTHEGCGGAVHRLISAPALQFKGSGWYITDYAKGGGTKKPANGDDSGKSAKSKSDAPASKDAKSSSSTSSSESKKSSDTRK
jgi:putative FmdB family regulatory protein